MEDSGGISFSFCDFNPRYMVDSESNIYGPRGIRKYGVDSNGYRSINTTGRRHRVHRLVAEALIPNPRGKPEVAHYDGDQSNNKVSNLYWATRAENAADRRRHGTQSGGTPKLDWDKVREIRDHPVYRGSQKVLAEKYGVHQVLISMVLMDKIWKERHHRG